MQYQQLGPTGVFVSRLCLGTMTFGGAAPPWNIIGALTQPDADTLVGQALDAGVNFFDTANGYAGGESEKILGKSLGSRRHDAVIATKVFFRMGPKANETGLSRLHITRQADESLKRLNTDYIDLYQIHRYDPLTPLDETLRALDDLVRQGKVRYIGCSNLSAWQIMKSLAVSSAQNLEKFVTVQAYYSLAGRDLEREIVPLLEDQKLGLLPWSPLAGGFLSGKFTRAGASEKDARRAKFDFPPIDVERAYNIIDALQPIAQRKQSSVAQVALAWLLHQPVVTSVIIGAKNTAQLTDNLASADLKLDSEELKQLDEVSRLKPEYPGWMLNMQSDRRPGEVRDWSRAMKSSS